MQQPTCVHSRQVVAAAMFRGPWECGVPVTSPNLILCFTSSSRGGFGLTSPGKVPGIFGFCSLLSRLTGECICLLGVNTGVSACLLDSSDVLCHSSGSRKSEIQVSTDLVSSEVLHVGTEMVVFPVCSHVVFCLCVLVS